MSRIDVQTLVLAFEKRISELEKNPPDKISTGVIVQMLEKSIDEIIKDHFHYLVKIEMRKQIKTIFKEKKESFITSMVQNIFMDRSLHEALEKKVKRAILDGIKTYD